MESILKPSTYCPAIVIDDSPEGIEPRPLSWNEDILPAILEPGDSADGGIEFCFETASLDYKVACFLVCEALWRA